MSLSLPLTSISLSSFRCRHPIRLSAAPNSKSQSSFPSPSDDEPPEAPEDSSHGVSKFQQFDLHVSRAKKIQESEFKKDQHLFLAALAMDPKSPDSSNGGDDLFGDIDNAIALKRQEFIDQGLIKPDVKKEEIVVDGIEELLPEEVVDLDEIKELQGLTTIPADGDFVDGDEISLGSFKDRVVEVSFKMSLAELLDEARVMPMSVHGDLEVLIGGIQNDPREVNAGDLFVCVDGSGGDEDAFLKEAYKRGAVAILADKEIDIDDTLECKAVVIVEDTSSVLPLLAASFYKYPSKDLSVIGVTGSDGKTTTTHLVKAMYEAMGLRMGMLGKLGYYIHGDNKVEAVNTTPDAVLVQRLMAKMVHNGTEAVVMEASSHGLGSGGCDEVDFDIAVFTNLTRDYQDAHATEEEYRNSKAKLFSKMVDPHRHRKVVNIDDPNAPYFVEQGNPNVPVVTYAMENKNADVHPLKFELSLFETQVLVQTPQGILEISSGLLGKHNIYNILAAVAVGIAVGAPLEDIVRGIEEVDGVPGRFELIDEEQAFAVVVDYAHTPDALSRLLDAARELDPRRVITVFGCCGEGDRGKRPQMTKIATDKSDVVILTSDNPRNEDPLDILDDMLVGVGWTMQDYLKYGENDYYPPLPNGHRLFLHDIRRVAVRAAVAMGEEGDIVVVAGKGHETYQIEGEKKEFFDDREECREALHYVDELHQAGIDTSEFPWRLPESH